MANGQHSVENVPKAKVGEVVQRFIDLDDAKRVDAKEQPNGTWTVTAFT